MFQNFKTKKLVLISFLLILPFAFGIFLYLNFSKPNLDLKENWTKVFPYAYPQRDDLTPVPVGPFQRYETSGYYNVVDTVQLASMFGMDPGDQIFFSCLVLDVEGGYGAVKFLFDKRIYSLEISKVEKNRYQISSDLKTREIVFLSAPGAGSKGSMYRFDFYDGISGCGDHCEYDNYAASNASLFVTSLNECIEMNLESTIQMMKSINK